MDVHRAGGGIHFTVEHTRAASSSELLASLSSRLTRMQRAGTTLVECKSGYGLELQTELKMLEVIEEARRTLPINISSTYCGAHAVPKYAPSSVWSYLTSHPEYEILLSSSVLRPEGRQLQRPQRTSCRFSCPGWINRCLLGAWESTTSTCSVSRECLTSAPLAPSCRPVKTWASTSTSTETSFIQWTLLRYHYLQRLCLLFYGHVVEQRNSLMSWKTTCGILCFYYVVHFIHMSEGRHIFVSVRNDGFYFSLSVNLLII